MIWWCQNLLNGQRFPTLLSVQPGRWGNQRWWIQSTGPAGYRPMVRQLSLNYWVYQHRWYRDIPIEKVVKSLWISNPSTSSHDKYSSWSYFHFEVNRANRIPFLLDRDNFVDHQSPPPAVPVPKKQCLDNGGSGGLGSLPQMAGPRRDIGMVHPLLLSYASFKTVW